MSPLVEPQPHSRTARPPVVESLADDIEYYLTQSPRQLPSRYLYDALGSALFEAICVLPWYRVTRAEAQLLDLHGREVFTCHERVSTITELGPGSGDKLQRLLAAGRSRSNQALRLHLVDISASALAAATRALSTLDNVTIVAHEAPYDVGLQEAAREHTEPGRTLVLFLGSNIGNFDRPGAAAFLRTIRAGLSEGDGLLLGADLVKPESELLLAYDDPLGVTAAFNRNLLLRINRELDADFDVDAFAHRAVWNAQESRVEMHLVARRPQRVRIQAAAVEVSFNEGEPIWTESSYKYWPEELTAMLESAGFRTTSQWIEGEARFALTLAAAR